MKLPIVLAGSVLITTASVSWAQQASPNTTAVQQGKPQQQRQKIKPRRSHAQPKPDPQASVPESGKRSTLNPVNKDTGQAVQRSTPKEIREQALNAQLNQAHPSYSDALRNYRHERHDRVWWKRHFTTIVLVGGGYYYWNAGYWCPAWGYDPAYEYYDYDGPIYTYGNLLPDQVIVNVQRALQQLGYYGGAISGALSGATRSAIAAYQEDYGLEVTAVVDGPTVAALGLI